MKPQTKPETTRLRGFLVGEHVDVPGGWHALIPPGQKLLHLPPYPPSLPPTQTLLPYESLHLVAPLYPL